MNQVVDSSGWLEYFAAGPNAAHFREPLTQIDRLIVPTITLFEVFKVVHRQRGEDAAIPGPNDSGKTSASNMIRAPIGFGL